MQPPLYANCPFVSVSGSSGRQVVEWYCMHSVCGPTMSDEHTVQIRDSALTNRQHYMYARSSLPVKTQTDYIEQSTSAIDSPRPWPLLMPRLSASPGSCKRLSSGGLGRFFRMQIFLCIRVDKSISLPVLLEYDFLRLH